MNASPSIEVQPTLAAWLLNSAPDDEQILTLRRLRRQVAAPLLVAGALVALWCAWAPLSGAVVASGQVQAALGRKVVQHQEGGIVRSLLVRQGQAVKRGDPLLVVGDVRSAASAAASASSPSASRCAFGSSSTTSRGAP